MTTVSGGRVAVILAGGRNTRFPSPKAFIEVDGKTIIRRQIETLFTLADSVVISTNQPELYFHLGLTMIGDIVPSMGPMTGIYSALRCTGAPSILAIACDMPFISEKLLKYMLDNSFGDATVCRCGGRVEPLAGIYMASSMPVMQRLLASGQGAMEGLLERLDVRYIAMDDEIRSFVNINTVEDFEANLKRYITAPGRYDISCSD